MGYSVGCAGVVGMALFFPLSRAGFNISVLLMLVGWVLAGQYASRLKLAVTHPASWPFVAYFLLVLVGLAYTEASGDEVTRQLSIYSKLLYVPLMLSLLQDAVWIRRAWWAFYAGCLVLLLSLYSSLYVPIPGGRNIPGDPGVFNNAISQGLALAALTLGCAHMAWQAWARQQRVAWVWAAAGVAALVAVMHINPSRGPQLALACGLLVMAWNAAKPRWRLAAVGAVLALLAVVAGSSTMVQNRFAVVAQEIKTLETTGKNTSVGLRLLAWHSAAEMWQSSPILGVGTGGFQHTAHQQYAQKLGCDLNSAVCDQPHSQFALTGAELGTVGLIALLALFWVPVRWASRQSHPQGRWLAPFVGMFVVHSLFDGGLEINSQAFVFIVAMGLTLATLQHQQTLTPPDA
jgi:O-antigen ligase